MEVYGQRIADLAPVIGQSAWDPECLAQFRDFAREVTQWKFLTELKFCLLETRVRDHDYAVLANRIHTMFKRGVSWSSTCQDNPLRTEQRLA